MSVMALSSITMLLRVRAIGSVMRLVEYMLVWSSRMRVWCWFLHLAYAIKLFVFAGPFVMFWIL